MTLRKNQPKMNVKSWSFSTTGMGRVILPASQLASTHSSIASSSMQGASTGAAASEAAASAIRTRGANCAGLASAGRTESAEGPRASVYAEAEPAKRANVVVRSMVGGEDTEETVTSYTWAKHRRPSIASVTSLYC